MTYEAQPPSDPTGHRILFRKAKSTQAGQGFAGRDLLPIAELIFA